MNKATKVRKLISKFKLTEKKPNTALVKSVVKATGLSPALAKTYIANNWKLVKAGEDVVAKEKKVKAKPAKKAAKKSVKKVKAKKVAGKKKAAVIVVENPLVNIPLPATVPGIQDADTDAIVGQEPGVAQLDPAALQTS
jgi:hypothetical protein